jgi:hypothetical protein
LSIIYRKSAQGQEEIERRQRNLPPRLRSALILVDGRRTDTELHGLLAAQPAEALQTLLELGLIEPVAAAPAPPAPRSAKPSFEQVRRDAVRRLNDLMGPMAESLAVKMERAASAAELRPLVETAASVIRNVRGAQAAADYVERCSSAP